MTDYTEKESEKRMKPRFSLLPQEALAEVAEIMTANAERWGADGWRKREPSLYEDAALRHINKHLLGEKIDPESGFSHWGHAAANALIACAIHRAALDKPQSGAV